MLAWEPKLGQMPAFGVVASAKVAWPTPAILQKIDTSNKMKLKSIELGFNESLYEVRMTFTNGVKSNNIKSGYAGQSTLKHYEIDVSRKISDVYIN